MKIAKTVRRSGPGDMLAAVFRFIGVKAFVKFMLGKVSCSCPSRQAQMNRWGWGGSLLRLPWIPFWLAGGVIGDLWRKRNVRKSQTAKTPLAVKSER